MYKKPGSPYWYVSYTDHQGARREKSSRTASKRTARKIEESARAGMVDVVEILAEFMADNPRPSHAADKSRGKHLAEFFTGQEITPETVLSYREARRLAGAGASTINKEIGLLSGALQHYAHRHGLHLENPCHGARMKEPPGRVRYLSDAERARLVDAARENHRAPWLAPFVRLALNTGMRKGELLNLEWNRVDLSGHTLYLTEKHTKNDRPRLIPLNKDALAAILELRELHRSINPRAPWVFVGRNGKRIKDVRRSFGQACKAAGLEDFHIHDERHDCASRLAKAGESLYVIKELLGHQTIQTTERYAHLSIENTRRAVDKL